MIKFNFQLFLFLTLLSFKSNSTNNNNDGTFSPVDQGNFTLKIISQMHRKRYS